MLGSLLRQEVSLTGQKWVIGKAIVNPVQARVIGKRVNMTITCNDFGHPPGCSIPVSAGECSAWIAGLQDRFGDPPAGAYFWSKFDAHLQTYQVSLCFDDANPAHLEYATITADSRRQ